MQRFIRTGVLFCVLALAACDREPADDTLRPELLRTLPHDASAYTQGLLLHEGRLFESTGQYGRSTLREVELETGRVLRTVPLPDSLFGEGLALVGDRLIQLTWKAGEALVHDRDTFDRVGAFQYEGEGWGLCFDGASLFMTTGDATLYRRDPATFELLERRPITLQGAPLSRVNELECVGDEIWGNVYLTDLIVRIDKATGAVRAVYDASALGTDSRPRSPDAVLNGIAHDPRTGTFYLTGKLWPAMFEVRFPDVPQTP